MTVISYLFSGNFSLYQVKRSNQIIYHLKGTGYCKITALIYCSLRLTVAFCGAKASKLLETNDLPSDEIQKLPQN